MSTMQQAELDLGEGHRAASAASAAVTHAGEPKRVAPDLLRGGVVFASAEEQLQRCTELLGAGALLVTMPPPSPDARGRLGDLLEELVERELARMGAPSPYLAAWCAMPEDAQARLADQLFRTRAVGATGLVIALGSLHAIAHPELTTDDSATLRWLADTTAGAPLLLLIDDSDLLLLGHDAPKPLGVLLSERQRSKTAPESGIQVVVSEPWITPATAPEPTFVLDAVATTEVDVVADVAVPAEATIDDGPSVVSPPPQAPAVLGHRRRGSARVTAGIPESGPSDVWRTWAIALSGTRGAQSLGAFERLFVENYVPLTRAIGNGLDDARALQAHDEFRRSFERSYYDAFATFGATNRRPRLVMDAYDVASKQARIGSARGAHVLVVDSLRFDLGCLVRDALVRETAGIASMTAETLLWSALPTTTIRQIETFARGLDALREPAREEPSDSLRGRAAEVVRRMRVGSRELYKLDLVASMLDGGAVAAASFETIANATAEAIARHISTLPPRTLLLILGDHGFTIDRHGHVSSGGASPEEVLVPAMSWLVGELQ